VHFLQQVNKLFLVLEQHLQINQPLFLILLAAVSNFISGIIQVCMMQQCGQLLYLEIHLHGIT